MTEPREALFGSPAVISPSRTTFSRFVSMRGPKTASAPTVASSTTAVLTSCERAICPFLRAS